MALLTRTYTFTDGTVAYGSQVETEIANLVNTMNSCDQGNTTWANVKVTTLSPQADVNFASHRITSLGTPTTAGDAAQYPITSAQITDGTITGTDIAAATITTANIASGTITGSNIATGTVTTTNIADGTITSTDIAAGTITGTNIASATVARANLAADAIPAFVTIGVTSAASSATVAVSSITQNYTALEIYIDSLTPGTDAVSFRMRLSTGAGFLATNYSYENLTWAGTSTNVTSATSQTSFDVMDGAGTGAAVIQSVKITVFGADNVSPRKRVMWETTGFYQSGLFFTTKGGGEVDTNSAFVDGVQFFMSSGNIAAGTFRVYGVRNT